jgi:signal transduction histidine kinase
MHGGVATVNENSSQASEGNGIGLPLVQRLVREMGAEIEFDSAPGKGTVVLIAFGGRARRPA